MMHTMKKMSMAVASRTTFESSSAGSCSGPSFLKMSDTVPQNSIGSNAA